MSAVLLVQPKLSSHKTLPSVSPLQVFACFWLEPLGADVRSKIRGTSPGYVRGSPGPRGFLIWGPQGGGGYCSPQRYCSGLVRERQVRSGWALARAVWAWHCGDWQSCAWWERRPPHRCHLWGEYGAQSPLSEIQGGSWSCGLMFATQASPVPHRGRWSCGMHSPPGSEGKEKGQGAGDAISHIQ